MSLKRLMNAKVVAMVVLVCVLPACPQGGGPLSIDMMRYWPMAVGNFWTFENKSDSDNHFVLSVVQDLSTARNPAFGVKEDRYVGDAISQSFTQYYIWRHDFLVRTSSLQKAEAVLAQPDASAYDLFVEIELPRYATPSISPRLFKDVEPGERLYTMTGTIAELFGQYKCADSDGLGLPYEAPVSDQTAAVLQMGDARCEGQAVIGGWDLFARDVGPVDKNWGRLTDFQVN